MPFILLILGLVGGAYVFYRFFIGASVDEIKVLFRKVFLGLFALLLLYFAVTGKIGIAILLVLLCIPIAIAGYREKSKKTKQNLETDDIIENEVDQNDD